MAAGDLITDDGQLEWRGVLLGAGTPYRLRSLEGWNDLPDARSGDVELDNEHGALPGQLLAGPRVVTLSYLLSQNPGTFTASVAELARITAWDENPEEEPLVVQLDGVKAMVSARCVGRIVPTERSYSVGHTAGTLRWRATNPRKLHLPQQRPGTTAPASGGGGLVWPLVWPLVWGSARAGGELVLTNTGNAHAQPVWRITGPCTGPVIRNADDGRQLEFNPTYAVPAGQALELATEDRSVLLGSGVSRNNQLVRRQWFTLPPGTTRVRFDTVDGLGQLECLYYPTSL